MSDFIDLQDDFNHLIEQTDALIFTVITDEDFVQIKFSRLHYLLDIAHKNMDKIKNVYWRTVKEVDDESR